MSGSGRNIAWIRVMIAQVTVLAMGLYGVKSPVHHKENNRQYVEAGSPGPTIHQLSASDQSVPAECARPIRFRSVVQSRNQCPS